MDVHADPHTIDAHNAIEVGEYRYYAQPHKVGCDNTIFQTLMHNAWARRSQDPYLSPVKSTVLVSSETATKVPSLSASQRIRAWETAEHDPVQGDDGLQDAAFHLNVSGMELFTDAEKEDFELNVGLHNATAQSGGAVGNGSPADTQPAPVPFRLRMRELEKRFREQVDVHRGLTRAARQLQVTEASVQAFRAERRTHALLTAINARQEALWRRVWPDGDSSALAADPATEKHGGRIHSLPTAPTLRPPRTPTAVEAPAPVKAESTAAASPVSAASPTSDLLRDILKTFSKPRELRGNDSSASQSVASPLTSGTGAARDAASNTSRTATGREAKAADKREDSFPQANRVTASGIEIVPPPRQPKPYSVIRYVEVHPNNAITIGQESEESTGELAGGMRKATLAAHVSNVTTSPSAISEQYSDDDFIGTDTFSSEVSDNEGGEVDDDVAAQSSDSSAGPASSPIEEDEEAYSNDTFEVEDQANEIPTSTPRTSVSSDINTERIMASSSLTDSVAEDWSASSIETSSVPSTVADTEGSDHVRHRRGQRSGGRKRERTADEVVAEFLSACDSVNAAAKKLLRSPFVREHRKKPRKSIPVQPLSPTTSTQTTTSSASVAAREEERNTDGVPGRLGSSQNSTKTARVGADTASEWRDGLEKQLRNVRHLRRFRTHLVRHLEVLEVQQRARKEEIELLKEAQMLAKARHGALHRSPGDKSLDVADLLRKVKGVQKPPKATAKKNRLPKPPNARHRADGSETISDEIATEITSTVGSADSSAIDEDIEDDFNVSDEMEDAISESIEQVPDESERSSAVDTEFEHGSISSIVDDVTDSFGIQRGSSSYTASFISEETHAADVGHGRSSPRDLAGAGLDEIEEELADRLADLSSSATSWDSRVPSEVEELVDLLPSSLIPSEVEGERNGTHASSSSIATASAISTETDNTSVEALRGQQRRAYVAVRSGAGPAGGEYDNKAYMKASLASSVYTVSDDADVDTSMPSSEMTLERVTDVSGAVQGPPKEAPSLFVQPQLPPEDAQSAGPISSDAHASSDSAHDSSFSEESDSVDALSALEMDMALTATRRSAALRSAASVPSFEQLYNPLVPSVDHSSATKSEEQDPESKEGLVVERDVSDSSMANMDAETRAEQDCAVRRLAHPFVAETVTVEETATSSRAAPAYPKEDLVAQHAWKARQLHLLRQLRALNVEDAVGEGMEETAEGAGARDQRLPQPKSSVDTAMDAAEEAAREEWAQHWGLVESLIQTRFASPRYEARMTAPARVRPSHTLHALSSSSETRGEDLASRSS